MVRRFVPERVWIERAAADSAVADAVRASCAEVPIEVVDRGALPAATGVRDGKRILVVQPHRGTFLRHCPAGTAGLVCCNYLVVNFASNCPMDCSYCFLQDYLADSATLAAFSNVEDALSEIDAVLRAHPERSFRIGTGELADSLALDPLTGLSRLIVPFFATRGNATLELKTKTDCIDELLGIDPRGRVVVSWSLNPPLVIARDEPGTATLAERLAAAQRVVAAGYRVGFHFDPLIEFEGWQRGYGEVIDALRDCIDRRAIAWLSLGSLRVSPALAGAIRRRPDPGGVLAAELVPSADGKARVWRGLRLRMYRFMVERLRRAFGDPPLYLCMEPAPVWERVMGDVPSDRALGLRLAAGGAW